MFVLIICLAGCSIGAKNNTDSDNVKFKEEYESLNGVVNDAGKEHRSLSIDQENPFVYATPEDIVTKIKNKETFYVYFGSSYCPWCRSVIETAIKVAKEKNIATIYYVDIWDGDHKEILRDTYELDENGKPKLVTAGTDSYEELLKAFDKVLSDYTLTNKDGKKVKVGEKRIMAPNFIYVSEGEALKLTSAISSHQKDARAKLTKEILQDEESQFQEFFSSK